MKTTRFLQIIYGLMLLAIMFVFSDCARAQVVVKIQDPTGLYTALKNATTLSANQTVYFPKSIDGKTVVVVNAFSSTQTFQAGDIPYASTSVNYLTRLTNPGADTFYLGLSSGLPHWNDKDWVTQVPSGPNENNIFPTSTGLVNLSLQSAGGPDDLLDFIDNSGGVISNFDNTGKLYYGGDPVLSLDGLSVGNDGAVVYDGTIGNNFASVNGTAGYVLTSNGTGTLPTFQAGGGSIDTNYVVTHPNVTTSTSHNWIIPSVDAIPLRIENIVGGVANMFGVLYNSGLTESTVFTIGNTGDLTIQPASDIVPLTLSQFGGGTSDALQIDGSTVFDHSKNLPVARLNSGTSASGSTFWRGDGTWATPSAGMTNPMTTLGDIIYENATPAPTRLAGNTSSTKNFLTQTGTGTISAVPSWGTIATGDIPDLGSLYIKNQYTTQSSAGFNITGSTNTVEAQIATTYTAGSATALRLVSNNTNGSHANYGLAFDVAGGATNFDLIGSSSTWSMTNAGALALGSALTVPNGGTGAATLTGLLFGNGTSAITGGHAVALASEVTGILPAANGGTANGFTAFTGPASSTKTFTLPNASATILTSNAAVTVAQGGTGQTSYTDGQLLIGNTTGNTLAKSTLTAGTGITITNGSGAITVTNSGVGSPGSSYSATPSNPTGTTSATQVMMGLAGSITPTASGSVLLIINGNMVCTGGSSIANAQIRYGTGTAPTNGATATGTTVGSVVQAENTSSAFAHPYSVQGVVTGLTVGTAYWIDLGLATGGAGTATTSNVSITAIETPSNLSLATYQATPTDPATTTNTTGVMMGLAGSITPLVSGNVLIAICGDDGASGTTGTNQLQIRYGTGTAPTNGAGLTGTTAGGRTTSSVVGSGQRNPFSVTALVTGLTVGTAYWIDLGYAHNGGTGNGGPKNVSISAVER